MSKEQYDTNFLNELPYFNDSEDIVPIGDLIGIPSLNCTKQEFKQTLMKSLIKYSEVFEILRME